MPSIITTWYGSCSDQRARHELTNYIAELAQRSQTRLEGLQPQRPKFLEAMTAPRSEGLSDSPPVQDHRDESLELAGNILVPLSIFNDEDGAKAAAQSSHVPTVTSASGNVFMQLDRLSVQGIDFQLFDPRSLYPGEDRASFMFVLSDTMKFMHGTLVHVEDRQNCQLYSDELVQQADWFVKPPSLHLRYYLEDWSDNLMSWIKYFFIPNLEYSRWEPMSNWEVFRDIYDEHLNDMGIGRDVLKRITFNTLLQGFEEEADEWIGKVEEWVG